MQFENRLTRLLTFVVMLGLAGSALAATFTPAGFAGRYSATTNSGFLVSASPINTADAVSKIAGDAFHVAATGGSYSDAAIVLYFDGSLTLGELQRVKALSTGSTLSCNLWLDTSGNGQFFAFNGDVLTGLGGDSYAGTTMSGPMTDSSSFYMLGGNGAGGTYTLHQLKNGAVAGISGSTKVALWIGFTNQPDHAADIQSITVDTGAGNVLSLDPTAASLYVKPGHTVVIDMNVFNLQQMVNGCQALLGFSSTYLTAAPGCVVAGGGVWNELIYNSWDVGHGVAGKIDTAIGVTLDGGPAGTQADGNVAVITLTAGATEGTTNVVFRADGENGYATMLSDMSAQPVMPYKVDSATIVIDGTAPVITTTPSGITTVTVATQTLTGTVTDNLAGVKSLTSSFNGGAPVALALTGDAFSQALVLHPGTNTVVLTATDKAGNVSTATVTYTYNQPAPAIQVYRSLAPNKYGSSNWTDWLSNAVSAVRDQVSVAVGSGYSQFQDFGDTVQDFTSIMVTGMPSWKGLVGAPELGTAVHFVWRLDNGVKTNPGAAKLDVTKINIAFAEVNLGADAAGDNLTTDYSGWWNDLAAGASFGQTSGFGSALKGFNWDGTQWVEVTSGTQADLIVYGWFRYAVAPEGNPGTPDQAVLNHLYKQLSGAAAFTPDPRRTLDRLQIEVKYQGVANVGNGTSGQLVTAFHTADATNPVVTISAPADGAKVNVPAQTISGTVTDSAILASGVREVKITLNGTVVYTDTTIDPAPFAKAVTLVEGDNTITVDAKDFAGNTASQTIHVLLDTHAPTLTIDSAVQNSTELLISKGSTVNGLQGSVTITVSAADADPSSALVTPPTVKVTDAGAVETVLTASGSGPWTYTYTISSTTANGVATIAAHIADQAGNTKDATDTFKVNKNQVTGQVELQGFVGASRLVTFVVTAGSTTKTYTPTLSFSGGKASYTLTDVPEEATAVSAKTAWTLRKRLGISPAAGQSVAEFTGGAKLLAGDINGDNFVNILDYSLLKSNWGPNAHPVADVNGDGQVQLLDYSLMQSNWFVRGDAQ
jgi:hypothetical protein